MRRADGQASIELVALLPAALLVALVVAQALAAGRCRELAAHAATAGAAALLQDADPRAAAAAAIPGWSRRGVAVLVDGRRVTVTLRPPALLPGMGAALRARAVASAGPAT